MHLNSEALRQNSPVVDVEGSLTAFVRRIQARPPTGPEIRAYKEQLTRLSAATVRLAIGQGDHALQVDTKIVGAFDLWFAKDARQRVMWPSTVRLSLGGCCTIKDLIGEQQHLVAVMPRRPQYVVAK